jgi:hypothetical protein
VIRPEGFDKESEHPELLLNRCDCGEKCGTVVLAMRKPTILPIREHPEELVCKLNFPLSEAQGFVDHLRKLAAEQGFIIK